MSITERTRHQLYLRLEAVLGTEEATTLMEHLPPVGWADVATKGDLVVLRSDLHALETRMDLRFEAFGHRLDSRISELRAETQHLLRVSTLAVITANAAIVSLIAALTNLF